ncbi:LysR family transcriptional regulator [Lactobacillus delbrueckii]|uniref:LysR family transcriptional regulator n=1 Tax=Lactobacillus delbrueckii TaxID=1584 RepID=UPI0022DF5953|nr:LysR family transcriptional regulator [Lactobacillus delbrueckii]
MLDKIQAFVSLAGSLSFSRTADELYTSQSTVSKHIAALEKEVGMKLFERSSRRVRLTREGEYLLPYAQRLLADSRQFDQAVATCRQEQTQTLDLYAIPTMTNYDFFKAVTAFMGRYPEIDLLFHEGESRDLAQKLRRPQDLLFLRKWDEKLHPDFDYLFFEDDELALFVAGKDPLAKKKQVKLADLAGARFLTLGERTYFEKKILAACQKAGYEPNFVYQGERIEAILEMVRQQLGIALLMKKSVSASQLTGLKRLDLAETISSQLCLVRLKGRHNQAQELFWQEMKNSSLE